MSEATSGFELRPGRRNCVRPPMVLLLLLLAASLPGCAVCQLAKRSMLDEPSEFSWKQDRKRSLKTYRGWANYVWQEQCAADPAAGGSSAYEAGFKDGFVDYVYAGGTGEPPPVPPRKFWNVGFRTPQGQAASADWFAGFRQGAQVARDGGYRKRSTLASSQFLLGPQDVFEPQPFSAKSLPSPATEPLAPTVQPELIEPELVGPGATQPDTVESPAAEPEAAPKAAPPRAAIPPADRLPPGETIETPGLEAQPPVAPTIEQPAATPRDEPVESPTDSPFERNESPSNSEPLPDLEELFGEPDVGDARPLPRRRAASARPELRPRTRVRPTANDSANHAACRVDAASARRPFGSDEAIELMDRLLQPAAAVANSQPRSVIPPRTATTPGADAAAALYELFNDAARPR